MMQAKSLKLAAQRLSWLRECPPSERSLLPDGLEWLWHPRIRGLGAGLRQTAGRFSNDRVLHVYVDQKQPRARLAHPIPAWIGPPISREKLPVDVLSLGLGRPPNGEAARDGMVHIRHCRNNADEVGRICCLMVDRADSDALYLLSNAHVIALSGYGKKDDPVILRNGRDKKVGRLAAWSSLNTSTQITTDAAVALINPEFHKSLRRLFAKQGTLTGTSYYIRAGMRVTVLTNAGRMESMVTSKACYLDVDGYPTPSGGTFRVRLRDQIIYQDVTEPGDSGSAVLNRRNQLIGLHFYGRSGGNDPNIGLSAANRIKNVIKMFKDKGLDLEVKHSGPSPSPTIHPSPSLSASTTNAIPPPVKDHKKARQVLAKTIWGEARNQSRQGREAVAAVVVNRASKRPPRRWGSTIEEVCLYPQQFSCWNEDDANRAKIDRLTEDDASYRACLKIAQQALDGELVDPTNGATHYHTVKRGWPNKWGKRRSPCAKIGDHVFYNDVA